MPSPRWGTSSAPRLRRLDSGRCRMPEARVIPLRPDDDGEPRAVPPPAPPGWEEQLAGGLEFTRRWLTGENETDELGIEPDLTDHVLLPRSEEHTSEIQSR